MSWKFGNKVYRNLEEQVLENQKNSLKNAANIAVLAKKDDIKRVIYCEMLDGVIVSDDKSLPAYGAITIQEYFKKVGYLVAQLDLGVNQDQFMFALSRNITDDGLISFDFGISSDDAADTIDRLTYQISLDTETDTINFLYDDFFKYNPYSIDFLQLHEMLYPVSVDYQTVADNGQVQLPHNGYDMKYHPHVWLRVNLYGDGEPTSHYLKQTQYTIENGIVSIVFNSEVPGNSGMYVVLESQIDYDVFNVADFGEV